ncbi:hypothetical protein MKJ04_16630 [Pontibacter sp. E15-1]|uniref:hypothetical protein n=1 Tax=Pontibacter sp. E15-1 TaxID=2919918 RepID=UPI001F4F6A1F|nr:hypothetical protein [Pontibacter sp. E15-1]MCJ8166473.1 hypothetical protein [Pontibacter sp. E15-1]
MKYRSIIIGLVLGTLYGLAARLLIETEAAKQFQTMTLSFLFGVPAVIGAITVYFGTESQKASRLFRVCMPWVTVFAFLYTTIITLLEATICVVMLLPAFMLSASIGGVIMGKIIDHLKRKQQTLNLFLVIPFLFAPIESHFDTPSATNSVATEIVINADKETVWNNIKSVSEIKDEELKWSFAHFIGIPKPIQSELTEERVGGVRHIKWEKEIRFREVITAWQLYDLFSYDILVDHIPPEAIDKHVKVGGKYFDVLNGGYKITEIDKNTTKLTLSCTYRVTTNFNFYSKLWADFIMDDFQVVILNVVKERSENSNPLTTAKAH